MSLQARTHLTGSPFHLPYLIAPSSSCQKKKSPDSPAGKALTGLTGSLTGNTDREYGVNAQ
jgi:hypothetical protein